MAVLLSSSGLILLSAVPSVAASTPRSGTLYLSNAISVMTGPCSESDPNNPGGTFGYLSLLAKSPTPTAQTEAVYGYSYSIGEFPYCMQATYNGPPTTMATVTFNLNVAAFTDPLVVGFALYDLGTGSWPSGPESGVGVVTVRSPVDASPGSTCSSPVHVALRAIAGVPLATGDKLAVDVLYGSYPLDTSTLSSMTFCYGEWGSPPTASSITITAA
jgi:hypothetical protein